MNGIPSSSPTSANTAPMRALVHKVGDASQEFESVLLGQWLQDAAASFGSVPGEEDEDSGGSQMKNFAMQHLAQEITKSGGIGIAKIVESALKKSAGISPSTAESTSGSAGTVTIPQSITSEFGPRYISGEGDGK